MKHSNQKKTSKIKIRTDPVTLDIGFAIGLLLGLIMSLVAHHT